MQMVVGVRAGRPVRFGRYVVALALTVAAIELISFLPPGVFGGPSQHDDRLASAPATRGPPAGGSELQAAASSLAGGKGPAGGVPWDCTSNGVAATQCGSLRSLGSGPGILSPSPTWSRSLPPPARQYACLTYDVRDNYVLLFSGIDR
ncbi:MAG: hypothetical protein L3K15_09285, partial [Thermoplasmata archaeon]|nr:hypothetical protein [Thermoplasmata archaeon]